MTAYFVTAIPVIILIALSVKGCMWAASLIVLIESAASSFLIALVILFALPTQPQKIGPYLTYLPIVSAGLVLAAAALSIVVARRTNRFASGQHDKAGIAVIGLGLLLWLIGYFCFGLFVFADIEGAPNPEAATVSFTVLNFSSALALIFASRYETVRFPNLYRWIILWASVLMLLATFTCSLIFIYAYPASPPLVHVFWASFNTINTIPIALLFIAINSQFVKTPQRTRSTDAVTESGKFTFE